nr:unnamed protein product [Digitaria exilis]
MYNLSSLWSFHVEGNRLHGSIPDDVGSKFFPAMEDLSFANNRFTGGIPSSLSNLTTLTSLQLSTNGFTGLVPRDLGRLQRLQYLYMPYNLLEADDTAGWEFITSLANCSQLLQLSLSYNYFGGQLPSSVVNLSATLQYLYLSDCPSISGSIPQDIGNLVGLSILGLANTSISGMIPSSIGKLANLVQLSLYCARLSGLIPSSLGNLTRLNWLAAYSNGLEGTVPASLGKLTKLYLLDLSANYRLNGSIPKKILLPSLSYSLNLSHNSFSGPLPPEVGNLINLNQLNLAGNQLSGRIPDTIGNCLVLESLMLDDNMLEGSIPQSLQNVEGLQQLGSSKSFQTECETLRRVRHRSLIKIITCCSSIDSRGQDFKALVIDLMPNGSLDGRLHPKYSIANNTLSLAQRLDIAVNVIDALDYLHNHCQPPIVHCDVKPSNILLTEDMSARVGDFGISRILLETADRTGQNSNSTIGIRGSIGYVAPEYGEGSPISALGDVYSLEILLLEMFTGRSPTDDMFKESVDLHRFAEAVFPDRVLEIADPTIWVHNDANDEITRSKVQECLVSVVRTGISCSKQQPRERMPIQDAAMEMHAIRDANLMFSSSIAVEHGVLIGHASTFSK